MKKLVFILTVLAGCNLLAHHASGGKLFRRRFQDKISIGPSFSALSTSKYRYSFDLDTSYTYNTYSVSLNLKYATTPDFGKATFGPQVEFSMFPVLLPGVGFGYLFGDDQGFIWSLFSGIPVPIKRFSKESIFKTFFLKPYYRINFFYPESGFLRIHEFGIYFKFSEVDLRRLHWYDILR